MKRHLKLIVVLSLLGASVGGLFYFRGVSRVIELFRKQRAQKERPYQPSSPLLTQPNALIPVKLFFPSLTHPGMLEMEMSEIRASALDQNRAKQIVLKLIEGSKQQQGRTISQETVLRELFLTSDGTAYVDFSDAIQKNSPGGIECELQTIYSVVDSLTANLPAIQRVRFLIDDNEVETLMGHADLAQAFTQNLDYVVKP